jgi:hypothetical protein
MNSSRQRNVPISHQRVSAELPSTSGATGEGLALARAYDHASRHSGRNESPSADRPPESFRVLAGAVRAFVVAGRAEGSPPERVLAAMKHLLRSRQGPQADDARGDRLRSLILREFLESYYDAPAAASRVPSAIE